MIEGMTGGMTVDALDPETAKNAINNQQLLRKRSPLSRPQYPHRLFLTMKRLERKPNLKHGRKNERPRKLLMKPKPKQWLLRENQHRVSLFALYIISTS
jgi:hypothetical protein